MLITEDNSILLSDDHGLGSLVHGAIRYFGRNTSTYLTLWTSHPVYTYSRGVLEADFAGLARFQHLLCGRVYELS